MTGEELSSEWLRLFEQDEDLARETALRECERMVRDKCEASQELLYRIKRSLLGWHARGRLDQLYEQRGLEGVWWTRRDEAMTESRVRRPAAPVQGFGANAEVPRLQASANPPMRPLSVTERRPTVETRTYVPILSTQLRAPRKPRNNPRRRPPVERAPAPARRATALPSPAGGDAGCMAAHLAPARRRGTTMHEARALLRPSPASCARSVQSRSAPRISPERSLP